MRALHAPEIVLNDLDQIKEVLIAKIQRYIAINNALISTSLFASLKVVYNSCKILCQLLLELKKALQKGMP